VSGATLDGPLLRRWVAGASTVIQHERELLTQLDAAIGDADHGANMARGMIAVEARLADLDAAPGKLLTTAGSTLVSTVTAFEAALAGVAELGQAQEGDKTMIDALAPAARAMRAAVDDDRDLGAVMRAGAEAAEEGMRATVPLQARKGRASYLGERSVGHQDPGATSVALILRALADAVEAA
jgi:dihydroxyacetone kinase-like protein